MLILYSNENGATIYPIDGIGVQREVLPDVLFLDLHDIYEWATQKMKELGDKPWDADIFYIWLYKGEWLAEIIWDPNWDESDDFDFWPELHG